MRLSTRRSAAVVIVAGCAIALITLRAADELRAVHGAAVRGCGDGTGRRSPSRSACRTCFWGLGQPFAGAVADRYGAGRVLAVGGALYALGTALMALSTSAGGARPDRRRAARARPGRRLVHDRAGRLRAARAGGAPVVVDGPGHRRGLARAVPVRAARPGVHRRLRPGHRAAAAVGLRRPRAAAGGRADRPRRRRATTRRRRSRRAPRSAPRSRTRATCCSPPASSCAASTSPSSPPTCRPT